MGNGLGDFLIDLNVGEHGSEEATNSERTEECRHEGVCFEPGPR